MTAKTSDGKFIVFGESWTEFESGWGCRPDGYTLHLSKEHRDRYMESFYARQPKEVPREYSQPDNNLKPTAVEEDVYNQVVASGDGMWGPGRNFEKWEG